MVVIQLISLRNERLLLLLFFSFPRTSYFHSYSFVSQPQVMFEAQLLSHSCLIKRSSCYPNFTVFFSSYFTKSFSNVLVLNTVSVLFMCDHCLFVRYFPRVPTRFRHFFTTFSFPIENHTFRAYTQEDNVHLASIALPWHMYSSLVSCLIFKITQ